MKINNYTHLYFNPRNAMLFKKEKDGIQNDIVIIAFDKKKFYNENVIFSNKNAACQNTLFFDDVENLSKLDWNYIFSKYWHSKSEQQKMIPEVLVLKHISYLKIKKLLCLNEKTLNNVKNHEHV